MITAKHIRERLTMHPFQPFRIVTSSGEHYDILHHDWVLLAARTLAIGAPKTEGDRNPDGLHLISILHITALDVIPGKAKKK
ncbi:MAG: hypothetical protein HYR84_02320 [Planctomycetes bacterium]|nr:hypothetical protein [Planctomycetota bacterium]